MPFAFDKSARTYDADGRLHLNVSNISKAAINPYLGQEIPGFVELGLNADQIYKLFRDPAELAKAASTFNNLPLLSSHVPVSAADHRPELVVGSTGSDAAFETPYLRNSLVIWDQAFIDRVENDLQKELSSAYRYTPRMEPGEYLGEKYDGIMTNIIGNHVALVEVGRAGSDVVVGDSKLPEKTLMKFNKQQFKTRVVPLLAQDKVLTYDKFVTLSKKGIDAVKPHLAQDIELSTEELAQIIASAAQEEIAEGAQDDGDISELLKNASPEMMAKIKAMLSSTAQDVEEDTSTMRKESDKKEDDDMKNVKAMDAAIKLAANTAETNAMKRFHAIRKAEKDVQPLVGEVAAMDSAEAVYKYALDGAEVDLTDVHPSAYSAIVKMLISTKSAKVPSAKFAQDSASDTKTFGALFPAAKMPKEVY